MVKTNFWVCLIICYWNKGFFINLPYYWSWEKKPSQNNQTLTVTIEILIQNWNFSLQHHFTMISNNIIKCNSSNKIRKLMQLKQYNFPIVSLWHQIYNEI